MTAQNRTTLKGYFNTGDTPTEAQFADLIDSFHNPADDAAVQIQPSEGAFVDGDKTKLDGIETGATADQTGAEIKAAYEAEADTNAFTDALLSKLNGIEAGADVTDAANVETAIEGITFTAVSGATSDEVLIIDATDGGLKAVLWENLPGSGGGISNVVEDTTPQLGGTLDANGNTIDMGTNTITDTKVGQWDTAFGWGDHSSEGYLTAATVEANVDPANLTLTDAGGLFTTDNVEAALQEVMTDVNTIESAYLTSTTLASNANGDGASLIGVEDSAGWFIGTTVEAVLAENASAIDGLDGRLGTVEGAKIEALEVSFYAHDANGTHTGLRPAVDAGSIVYWYNTGGTEPTNLAANDVWEGTVQDAGLSSIAGLTTSADQMIYTTASDTYATTSLTSFARTILDDADASAARTTLGLAIGTDVQAYDPDILKADTADQLTAGYTATLHDLGTPAAASTVTLDASNGNYQELINDDDFTLEPMALGTNEATTFLLHVTNSATTPGTITFGTTNGGFETPDGDSVPTAADAVFFIHIHSSNNGTAQKNTVNVKAMA